MSAQPQSIWSDENLAGALAGLAGTMSAARIAEELSGIFGIRISRNAIIGKLARSGLPRQVATKARRECKAQASPVVRVNSKPVTVRPDDWRRAYGLPCGLMECTGCRWPVTADKPYLFCNAGQVQGSAYCSRHDALSRNPDSGRRQ